jgi:hypothetical protein
MGAEEWHLLKLLLPAGEVWYEAAAVVDHHVSAARADYETIRRRMWQLGFGHARSQRLLGEPQPAWPRVAVRTVRVGRDAARNRARYAAAGGPTSGDAAWADFYSHFWWGHHIEMLSPPRCSTELSIFRRWCPRSRAQQRLGNRRFAASD